MEPTAVSRLTEDALHIVASSDYLCLATTSGNEPWVSPLYFAFTSDLSFVFLSSTSSTHARNIRVNPSASWCVFLGAEPPESTDGVYFAGTACELHPKDAQSYGDALYDRRFPDAGVRKDHPANPQYWEKTGRRLYLLQPASVSNVNRDDPAGVTRVDLDLSLMSTLLSTP